MYRWRRPLPNRVDMYTDNDLPWPLPYHDSECTASNAAMHPRRVAMPHRRSMHTNGDMLRSMYRHTFTLSNINTLHSWRSALSRRVYMQSNNDLSRTLSHHIAKRGASNQGVHYWGWPVSRRIDLYTNGDLQRLMYQDGSLT